MALAALNYFESSISLLKCDSFANDLMPSP
jgi:hypothetical protein